MMKRLSLMLATLTWLVAGQVSPAWAAYWIKGNAFVDHCLSDDARSEAYCFAYVAGVADMVGSISVPMVSGFTAVCFPDETTLGQLNRVVVKYLKAHPEETHEPAVVLVTVALREAFPCQS